MRMWMETLRASTLVAAIRLRGPWPDLIALSAETVMCCIEFKAQRVNHGTAQERSSGGRQSVSNG